MTKPLRWDSAFAGKRCGRIQRSGGVGLRSAHFAGHCSPKNRFTSVVLLKLPDTARYNTGKGWSAFSVPLQFDEAIAARSSKLCARVCQSMKSGWGSRRGDRPARQEHNASASVMSACGTRGAAGDRGVFHHNQNIRPRPKERMERRVRKRTPTILTLRLG
jgi:hypothetical protein